MNWTAVTGSVMRKGRRLSICIIWNRSTQFTATTEQWVPGGETETTGMYVCTVYAYRLCTVCMYWMNTVCTVGMGDIGFNQSQLLSNKIHDYRDNRTALEC